MDIANEVFLCPSLRLHPPPRHWVRVNSLPVPFWNGKLNSLKETLLFSLGISEMMSKLHKAAKELKENEICKP